MLFDAGCVACDDRFGPVCGACSQALISAPVMTVAGVDVVRVGYALDERAKTIVAALKYKRQRRLATVLAQQLQTLVPRGADAITWIPATPARRRSRGYDQAEELARAFSRCSGVPALRLVSRRDTDVRQTGLSRVDRLRGPSLASAAPSPDFVVLVDDVITTGSSLRVGAGRTRKRSHENRGCCAGRDTATVRRLESFFSIVWRLGVVSMNGCETEFKADRS